MAKKEIATSNGNFPMEVPDYIKQDSGRGQEGVGTEDLSIPRIDVIQDLSPQHKKSKPEYIEGAEVGMLFNSVTNALYGSSVYFVPVFFRKEWIIWKHQDAGGGFFGAFASKSEAEAEMRDKGFEGETFKDKNGNVIPAYEVVDTGQQFGLILGEDRVEQCVMSMSKSKMKPNRTLNTLVNMAGGDRFSRVYEISAVEAQNKAGQDYWNLAVKQLGYAPEEVYRIAEKMYEGIASGAMDVNRSVPDSSVAAGEDGSFDEDNPK